MGDFEKFRRKLRSALVHLHDPHYRPDAQICRALGCDPAAGSGAFQAKLLCLIENLAERAAAAKDGRARRNFDVLHRRFVLGMTQEETAESLYLSLRSVQRTQQEAVHALACRLWQQRDAEIPASQAAQDWLSQVRQELLSLQKSDPDAECDLGQMIQDAWRLVEATATRCSVTVEAQHIQPGLWARFHPSALRQVFLAVIAELVEAMSAGGRITLHAERRGENPALTVRAAPVAVGSPVEASLAKELVAAQGGSIELSHQDDRIVLTAILPPARSQGRFTVLAVDDNADLVALYQSYCIGTRYEILHVKEGRRVFEIAEAAKPAAILLDVMLPDVDGWDLLMELRANPATRTIPVIICSVITDEPLALMLGAARYLCKPIWRQQLLDALEEVITQAASEPARAT